MPVGESIRRKGLWGRLKQPLKELRRRGVQSPRVDDLDDLLEVAESLGPDGATPAAQVVAVLELAIQDYASDPKTTNPPTAQEVARLWFGLDPATRTFDHRQRHKAAADRAGVTVGTFESHRAPKIINFLASKLANRYDKWKELQAATDEDSAAASDEPAQASEPVALSAAPADPVDAARAEAARPQPISRVKVGVRSLPRWVWATLGVGSLLLLTTGGYFLLDLGTSSSQEIPPPGTVINAANGQVAEHVVTSPSQQFAQVGGGNILRACNLSTETPCTYSPNQNRIRAHPGDVIDLAFRVHNPNDTALPYATFIVRHYAGNSDVTAKVEAEWPGASYNFARSWPISIVLSHVNGYVSLAYIPGSAELRDSKGRFLGHLPDGIMENGIGLANIGSPASCFYCDLKFVRYVHFRARAKGVNLS